ncbi:probable tRNA N6-adenosine threonylcarbamoyltransferase, mitochondrial [Strongylocentrotus purpuratus]|uniref:N(6)-L-threonylcarbamoyladenine synthase n=1 Tax=Strongylocentrotus purpuratus TaxID=7668 RepID=A0A7M7P9L6_STRPU|nr:probable tRNA N6-adenosine threonylcarbamoyltransferase, mitochondrial [Strongylocentrotus purpuratus]|eukprot:XP_797723.2 PREDICTED: probable tRNA N6-adenosine threonylcarbamoyltransferase, mitochondrial [Strongylocentrotus purpuratus]
MFAPTISTCKAPLSHLLQRCRRPTSLSSLTKQLCRHHERHSHSRLVLGIETTCDDTGAAVMDETGRVLAERLHTQKRIHAKNGGIIPPLAQALHRQFIDPVVQGTIKDAGIEMKDLSAVALSTMPGMPLSLRVGLDYTKDMLLRHPHLPLIPIHHMEAHALTVRMVERVDFPFLVLLVSGGNCILAVARGVGDFKVLGVTWDDAPGEAFDKVARRLKLQHHPDCLGLCGGQAIEKMAENGNFRLLIERGVPMSRHRDCNFSFAGLKNMANWLIQHHEVRQGLTASDDHHLATISDIAASFQHKVTQHLVIRIARAMLYCQQTGLIPEGNQTLVVSGGVASNDYIRKALDFTTSLFKYKLICPPPYLCTDNGVMIAWAGVERLRLDMGFAEDPQSLRFQPKMPLGEDISEQVTEANIKIKRIKFW